MLNFPKCVQVQHFVSFHSFNKLHDTKGQSVWLTTEKIRGNKQINKINKIKQLKYKKNKVNWQNPNSATTALKHEYVVKNEVFYET